MICSDNVSSILLKYLKVTHYSHAVKVKKKKGKLVCTPMTYALFKESKTKNGKITKCTNVSLSVQKFPLNFVVFVLIRVLHSCLVVFVISSVGI